MRIAIVRDARRKLDRFLGFNRLIHSIPQSPPLAGSINHGIHSVQPVLPEFSSPIFSFGGGSMELMAVPKRKVRYLHKFFLFFARHYRQNVEFY
jgi:large subunit ribosomal protein L32